MPETATVGERIVVTVKEPQRVTLTVKEGLPGPRGDDKLHIGTEPPADTTKAWIDLGYTG